MTEDILKKIKLAEADYDSRVAEAEAEAKQRIDETKRDCNERIATAKQKAAEASRAIAERSCEAANEYLAAEKTAYDKEARDLRIKGEVHLDEAVKLIVWGIVSRCQ